MTETENLPETELSTGPWLCFHCDETFTERSTAAEHFGNGDYEAELPVCIEAATTEQKQLIATNRELWEELQSARSENEDLEFKLDGWEYTARKLTKKPSAATHDLEHEWDFMEGRVIAAERYIPLATAFVQLQRENNPTERQQIWSECLRLAGELERLNK